MLSREWFDLGSASRTCSLLATCHYSNEVTNGDESGAGIDGEFWHLQEPIVTGLLLIADLFCTHVAFLFVRSLVQHSFGKFTPEFAVRLISHTHLRTLWRNMH